MKKIVFIALIFLLSSCMKNNPEDKCDCLNKFRGEWDYSKDHGPDKWAEVDPRYELCAFGKEQSPIDINKNDDFITEKEHFSIDYKPTNLHVKNNGHTFEVEYEPGSYISYKGEKYHLIQFHFHEPSEHTVNSKEFAMEMHVVHKHNDGRILVMGSFIEEGEHNYFFDRIWSNLPGEVGKQVLEHDEGVNLAKVFGSDAPAYYYLGSLTTPPCSEKVQWIVRKDPIEFSQSQIAKFKDFYAGNARKAQRGLNG